MDLPHLSGVFDRCGWLTSSWEIVVMLCGLCGEGYTADAPCLCAWERIKVEAYDLGVAARSGCDEPADSPLSGEWSGDWTPQAIADHFGMARDNELVSVLCVSFEVGYFA